ncbi:MAG: hypothetical protein HC812_13745 [Leptolyngbya sp. RL_3_1]|nr:hypothetical protein [Leptolyngbya sp. RL_3_1]
MSKRVFLTLPDVVYQELEIWAESQGRPVANLGAFLIETAIRQAKTTGEFPKESQGDGDKP